MSVDATKGVDPRADHELDKAGPLLQRLNQRGLRLLQMADVCVLLTVMVGTNLIRYGWDWPAYGPEATGSGNLPYVASFVLWSAVFVGVLYFGGLYEREPRLGAPAILPRTTRLSLLATLLIVLIGFVTSRALLPAPTLNLVVLFVGGSLGLAANRRLTHLARLTREGPPRVLLVGAPDEIEVARSHLEMDADRVRLVGGVTGFDKLLDHVEAEQATDVMLLSGRWLDAMPPETLALLERRMVPVLLRVTARETLLGLERIREVGGMPFVLLQAHALPLSRARFKRALETVAVVLLTPIVVPAVGGLALYVRLMAGPKVFFWQERVGKDGRTFEMVKFRTMVQNAEEDGRPQLSSRTDPRVIPACRWLRETRLDELPQLWNVLRGEMSLVGPRPERHELTERFQSVIPGYGRRHEIPPGMTGLAQIHGRYDTDPEYKLGYDLQYLVNWSPVLDLEILARTIWVVVSRRI